MTLDLASKFLGDDVAAVVQCVLGKDASIGVEHMIKLTGMCMCAMSLLTLGRQVRLLLPGRCCPPNASDLYGTNCRRYDKYDI